MVLGCVLIWSANVSFVKLLLRYWSPFSLASIRMLLALVAFGIIVWLREGTVGVRRRDIPLLLAAAAFGIFLNQVCFVFALHFTKASSVALLLSMIPVFVALISASLGIEPFSRWSAAGLVVSLAGVFLIVGGEPGSRLALGTVQGNIFALGTALSWAVYTILLQPLLRRYSSGRISLWVVAIGLCGLLPAGVSTFDVTRVIHAPWWTWALVLYSSLGAIVTTNFLWYVGTHRLGPARGSLYAFLQPFLGALGALVILSERISLLEIVGGGVVILGIALGRRKLAPQVDVQPPEISAGET